MDEALQQAKTAFEQDEVPVGAVIVQNQRVIARAYNMNETLDDPTAHAEMLALTQASEHIGDWRLENCDLYVTLEPCCMCAGAIVQSRIRNLIYGTTDPKSGACGSLYNIVQDQRLNHHVNLQRGVRENKCKHLLQNFFREKRNEE